MTNEEIIKIVNESCSVQNIVITCIGQTFLCCKEEDFKKKVTSLLNYLRNGGYNEHAVSGFEIFAEELLKIIDK